MHPLDRLLTGFADQVRRALEAGARHDLTRLPVAVIAAAILPVTVACHTLLRHGDLHHPRHGYHGQES